MPCAQLLRGGAWRFAASLAKPAFCALRFLAMPACIRAASYGVGSACDARTSRTCRRPGLAPLAGVFTVWVQLILRVSAGAGLQRLAAHRRPWRADSWRGGVKRVVEGYARQAMWNNLGRRPPSLRPRSRGPRVRLHPANRVSGAARPESGRRSLALQALRRVLYPRLARGRRGQAPRSF